MYWNCPQSSVVSIASVSLISCKSGLMTVGISRFFWCSQSSPPPAGCSWHWAPPCRGGLTVQATGLGLTCGWCGGCGSWNSYSQCWQTPKWPDLLTSTFLVFYLSGALLGQLWKLSLNTFSQSSQAALLAGSCLKIQKISFLSNISQHTYSFSHFLWLSKKCKRISLGWKLSDLCSNLFLNGKKGTFQR